MITVQSIWDENELDDLACEVLAQGQVWRLASQPTFPSWPLPEVIRQDFVQYVAHYKAEQEDERHWRVYGKFERDKEWRPVGWLVR